MVMADLFLCVAGIILVQQKNIEKQALYYGNYICNDSLVSLVATVNDLPVEKEKFVKCELKVWKVRSGTGFENAEGTIYAYFKKSNTSLRFEPGQSLLLKVKLQAVAMPKNPFEFDYHAYLYNRQIYHTAFVDTFSYCTLPLNSPINPVWKAGLTCKKVLLEKLVHSGLSKHAYSICAALLTGYDADIDKTVMDAFSHSGTLHVLSVSGLHVGLIYLVLNYLIDFFDRKRQFKLKRFVCITLVLWFFALITGFSAPVLRAVIMFSLLGIGKIYFRADYKHQMNILLVSAFLLLLYNPYFINDVGFLLSYFAMFGLMYFQPKFYAVWMPKNRLVNYGWQSITASFAATLSTLPVTLFYFKQFPVWFFVCNIIVVPATFILLILAVLIVLRIKIAVIISNYLVSGLIGFINVFNHKNLGFIDNIHFTLADVFFLSLLLVLIAAAVQYKSYKLLVMSLFALITWQITALIMSCVIKNRSLLSVYNIKNNSAVSVKNTTTTYLSYQNAEAYNFHVKPHINSFNYTDVQLKKFNVVKTGSHTVVFFNTPGFLPELDYGSVTTLVLAGNYKLTSHDLSRFKKIKTLVSDGSNNDYTAGWTEKLCRNFGLDFYNTKYKGAYLLTLP